MITIGNISLKNNIFLAPMAGVTDLAFRLMCKKWGAGLAFSEMISAKALHYNDKKTLSLLETHPDESPLAVQIFGSDPDIMAESAKKLEDMGVKILDINFGCPAPKITGNGEGSALLKEPEKIASIVKKVSLAVSVPVMCKIRCGFDDFIDVAEYARLIEDSGASALTVHGRTRKMFYSGTADRSKIREAKTAVSIPVIGNGDITDAQSALDMFSKTDCDAVMIGRGAEGNPFIFKQINELMELGEVKTQINDCDKLRYMKEHIELLINLKGQHTGVREARKHIAWYTKGMHAGANFRSEVFKTETYDKLMNIIDEYIKFLSEREDIK